MLRLQPFEVCKLKDVCFYCRDCKGLDEKRKSTFSCSYADEIKQEEKEERNSCEIPVCSLSQTNFSGTGCS
jgi:hypothetical protein